MREAFALSRRDAIAILALALVYFSTAVISLASFGANPPIWFGNAIAIACLLQQSRGRQLIGLAAVYLADMLAGYVAGGGPPPVIALADTAEVALATWAIQKIGGPAAALSSVSGLVKFVLICLAAPILSSLTGSAALWWVQGAPFVAGVKQWYAASALGLLVICPALLIWLTPELRPVLRKSDSLHLGLLTALLAVLALFVFTVESPAWLFALFPALLLLVWSSGLAGASVGSLLLVIVGLAETLNGGGSMGLLVYPLVGIHPQVHALQLFLAALGLSSMPLAVVLTDQRRLSCELARVAEARSEFLAAMSHEIRTPMTGVLGMVDLLEAEQPTPKQRRYIESIRVSGRHLLIIINDVLDFSRIETGKIQLENVDFSMPVLLEQLRALLEPMANERAIILSSVLPPGSPPVLKGDPTRLKQVLLNLAGNAIKFTPEGRVTLKVSHSAQGAGGDYRFRFEVHDTGIGIPPDKLAGLFSAFTQADHSTTRRFGGSGLGLAISKRLVDAMGGAIGVKSVAGKGSVFWFEVPLVEGDAVRTSAAQAQTDKPIRDLDSGNSAMPIIALTSNVMASERQKCLEAGMNSVLLKPVEWDLLRAVIDRLGGQRAQQAQDSPPAEPTAEHEEIPFREDVFARVRQLLPKDQLQAHVDALQASVGQLQIAGPGDLQSLEETAHKVVSQAGMLGLFRLSARAARIEQGCRSGKGVRRSLERFREAAGDVGDYLRPNGGFARSDDRKAR